MCSKVVLNPASKKAIDVLYGETQDLLYNSKENIATLAANEIEGDNWPLIFFREYVSKNLPLLIKGGAKSWSSVRKWSTNYFLEKISEKDVTVAITPNGYADGINTIKGEDTFFLPEEKNMKMKEFLKILDQQKPNYVCYIQKQNSNLTMDFPELLEDVDSDVSWANRAFGCMPDAVNFWMGDERAITSMHKDHYENIYIVVDGFKDFILIPPVDLPKVPYKKYPVLQYKDVTSDGFECEQYENSSIIEWISVDPLNENSFIEHPEFGEARKFHVRVEKGDIMYLPSLWFHHVRQSHKCIAVNYWYDMDFQDLKYCYYKMLASLCGKETCT